jgi:hypothetical protein
VDQSIYEVSSSQKTKLGTRLAVGERVYRYSVLSSSANVKAGDLLCAPQLIASHQSGIMSCASAATGATTITITAGTLGTANQYAEGYIVFASTGLAGGGQMFRIKSNTAWSSAGTGTVTLYDAIPGTLAAGPINLVPNGYNSVKVGSAALDVPVGVAPVAVTTGEYFWLQTWGPCAARHAVATPAAAAIALGTTGGVGPFSATGTLGSTGSALIDYVLPIGKNSNLAATASECNPVVLMIQP